MRGGFDVTHADFNELIVIDSQPLMGEDLAELTKSADEEEKTEGEDVGQILEGLAELMRTTKELHKNLNHRIVTGSFTTVFQCN
ncbi:hypothetical protein NPIL_332141 [Nephila pilipes]|uniref:Uncharacterized protein n=1 Tax=Nephila pilipes TaxID=299642 RepID=A0A8X6QBM4_NEPPI|nr:hypothetical protein NPIL_332141 [Nephila pilipes]